MEVSPGAVFIVFIMIIAFGITFRIIKRQTGLSILGMVIVGALLLPVLGGNYQYSTWAFWVIAIIVAINILRAVLSTLFGKETADGFTSSLLSDIFRPLFHILESFFKKIFGLAGK